MPLVTGKRRAFLELVGREVARQLEELRPDLSAAARRNAGAIVAAMWAHESGFGSSRAWREGWNGGNVSAGSSWKGETIAGGDLEYAGDGSGSPTRIVQRWRKYASLAAAVSDFFVLLGWSRYQRARDALLVGDAARFAEELRAGGYYTASLGSYRAALAGIYPDALEALA